MLPLGRDVEKQFVLDKRAAEVGVVNRLPVAVLLSSIVDLAVADRIVRGALGGVEIGSTRTKGASLRVKSIGQCTNRSQRIVVVNVVKVALGPGWLPGQIHPGMEVIAAAFADLANHATGRPAVFRTVP